jgi:hypothetical protein
MMGHGRWVRGRNRFFDARSLPSGSRQRPLSPVGDLEVNRRLALPDAGKGFRGFTRYARLSGGGNCGSAI